MLSKSVVAFTGATIAASLLMASSPAQANIVNVQSAMSGETKEGLNFTLTGSAKWFTGNADILFLSSSPMATFRAGKNLVLAFGKVDFAVSGDERIIFRTFEHMRYRHSVNKWLTPEVFVQHAFDEFRRLSIRALAGAGPSMKVLDLPTVDLSWGVSYMFEYEKLSTDQDEMGNDLGDSGAVHKSHRSSTYLMGSYNLNDRVKVVESVYFQPLLTKFSDFRLMSDTTLNVKLTKRVSLSTTFVIAYDTDPPEAVKDLDTRMLSSLSLSF